MKKIIGLLLTMCLMATMMMPVGAYNDVSNDSNVFEAVTVLSNLDILNGFEDGSFKPNQTITRAEMAKVICLTLQCSNVNSATTPFDDVSPKHWANTYINTAYDLGIINGYGDGNFGPEDPVTYEQAVKMLVAALGYEKKAQSLGGYPTGYMMVANQEGITSGTTNTGAANRGTVAKLTYNALTVPMMDQTSWGTNEQFNAIPTQSLLWSKLDAVKAEVVIDTIPLNKDAETVSLDIKSIDKVAQANGFAITGNVKINGVDLTDLQGLRTTVILDKSDIDDIKLLGVATKAGKNVSIDVDAELLVNSNDNGYVTYKKNVDDDKDSKFKVVANPNIYVNLVKNNTYTLGTNTNDIVYSYVDTDNNGVYDTVFVQNTGVFVVGSVNTKSNKIYSDTDSGSMSTHDEAVITLDPEDETVNWVLYDAKGNEITLADVKAGSVAAITASDEDPDANNGYEYYNITFYNDTVTGTIKETYEDKNGVTHYVIKDNDYTMLDFNYALTAGDRIVAKVYGDKIVACDVAEGVKNYGIVLATNVATDFDTVYQVQLLTTKGEIVSLNMFDKYNGNNFDTFTADSVITYELNSKGEIKSYSFVDFGTDNLTNNNSAMYKASSEKLGSLYITDDTAVVIAESAYGSNNKDTLFAATTDVFEDGESYTYTAVYDENREAKFVILYEVANQVNMDSDPIFVTKKATITVDNDTRTKYTGYVNGELVEYVVAEDVTINLDKNDVAMFATNSKGEIVNVEILAEYNDGVYTVFNTNTFNYDTGVRVEDDSKATNVATVWNVLGTSNGTVALKGFATVGKAYTVKGKILRLVNVNDLVHDSYGDNEEYITDVSIDPTVTAYSVDTTTDKVKVTTIADAETDVNTNDYRTPGQTDNGDYVYVYNYDGETKLVLIINTDND